MDSYKVRQLFDSLLFADSEARVVEILRAAGYWDRPDVWRPYGDRPRNWATIGSQQSLPDRALVEKLTNAIDAKLIAAAAREHRLTGPSAPTNLSEAQQQLYGTELRDPDELSKSITVAATGARTRPSITIVDDGEGVMPRKMPTTILSLHEGNKESIPFVQGKFNMGGSGVLEFCGVDRNVQLVLSRRNPALLPENANAEDARWSFTIVRREDPDAKSPRSSRFTYLAPAEVDHEGRRGLLTFEADQLPIFPEKNRPYVREAKWGTLFKLYEYGTRAVTNMMLEGGLLMKIRLLLPEPALPIRFHECRDYKGDPARSFDTAMTGLVRTLDEDRRSPKRSNVEWFDRFEIDVEGERFGVRVYLFRRKTKDDRRNPADAYRKDEGVIFTYNGQAQEVFSKDFFGRQRVRLDYLSNSLLVFVDCSSISPRAHEKLFMANRERARDGDLKRQLTHELEDRLHDHKELEALANARRRDALTDDSEVSETFERFIEQMLKQHPALQQVLGAGHRISNPFKPLLVESTEKEFVGRRFPSKFQFRGMEAGHALVRDAHLESNVRIAFDTDAENDYFRRDEEPGEFQLNILVADKWTRAENWVQPSLFDGSANLTISRLPVEATEGMVLEFEAVTTDPSRIEPFRNRFTLVVKPPRPPQEGTKGPRHKIKEASPEAPTKELVDGGLDLPIPREVYESAWAEHDPPFDRSTCLRIKRQPGASDGSTVFDYFINMSNLYLTQAVKSQPKRAQELRDRYKFGMTLIALGLVRHDTEQKGHRSMNGENEERPMPDVHYVVEAVTAALAPFLLPLVESLAQITERGPMLSETAGEAA